MSTTFSAVLLYGRKLEEIVSVEDIISQKTKYSEDTGEPYQIEVVTKKYTLGALEFSSREELWDHKFTGMECFSADYYGDVRFLGAVVIETSEPIPAPVPPSAEKIIAQVQRAFRELNISQDPGFWIWLSIV